MNILKKTKIILVILLVLFVCFFFCCQQKKENYIDVNHLKVACKKENTKKNMSTCFAYSQKRKRYYSFV